MKIKLCKKYTTSFRTMAFSGEPDEEVLATETYYDINGNLTEEVKVNDHEGSGERILLNYNDIGKLIRHEHIMEHEGISEVFVYTRDDKGRMICDQKFYGDDEGEKIVYHYLDHDQPVRIERYDSDGEPESFEELSYNPENHITEHLKFDPDKKLIEKTIITYNDLKLPVEKFVYDDSGNIKSKTLIAYNDKNELIRITEWNESGKVISDTITQYDEKSNVIERKIRDFHTRTLRFDYDDRNNCITEEVYDEHGNLTMRNSYSFDQNNLLIDESGYFLDSSRGGRNGNSKSRYEYEYWEE